MNYIDLHVHSTCSDGTYTPEALVKLAASIPNLTTFALTDHDTVSGVEAAIKESEKYDIKVIPGIELSSVYTGFNSTTEKITLSKNNITNEKMILSRKDILNKNALPNDNSILSKNNISDKNISIPKKDIHILGLNIDYKNKQFLEKLEYYKNIRLLRNKKMIHLLHDYGFDISEEKLNKLYPNAIMTRAHFARYLKDNGYVKDNKEAFEKYIGVGCPCYLPKENILPEDAIKLILLAGGHPILAHPMLYKLSTKQLEGLILELKSYGLEGIETIYSSNTKAQEDLTRSLAVKYKLFITGGSDFHGTNKPDIMLGTGKGNLKIPESLLNNII